MQTKAIGADGSVADPVLAGAIRCNSAVGSLAATFGRAPLQVLARLHLLAAAGSTDDSALGRPRADQGVAARLAGVADVVTQSGWPAPVVAAVVHAEVAVLRPFGSADGIVARAAGRIVMVHSGFDRHALTVPEVDFLRSRQDYHRRLSRYTDNGMAGVADWIVFVCGALVAGAREATSIADALGIAPTPAI